MMMKSQRQRHSRAQAGLSIIEVLAAVLLVSFGILGLLSLLSRATQASVGSEDTLRAALLANELSSAMWNAGTVAVPATTITAWNLRVADPTVAGLPGGIGTVDAADGQGARRITVSWTTPGGIARQYVTDVIVPQP